MDFDGWRYISGILELIYLVYIRRDAVHNAVHNARLIRKKLEQLEWETNRYMTQREKEKVKRKRDEIDTNGWKGNLVNQN